MVRRASPVRTCVGCRGRAPSSELLRVVAVDEVMGACSAEAGVEPDTGPTSREADRPAVLVVADPRRRRPGRGAHIHPDPTCLALAERRRAFGRALRIPGVVDAGSLSEFVGTTR